MSRSVVHRACIVLVVVLVKGTALAGEVWAQNVYVLHYDTWSLAQDFVYSSTSYITGGTGKYAGATGWFGFVGSELKGGIIHGEICTP